jgi:hypothetical protein
VIEVTLGPDVATSSVYGRNFPPGAQVRLRWDLGITARLAPVVVGADGTFHLPMIIFHKDTVGPRKMTASRAPVANAGPAFGPVTAKFLVVHPPDRPDDWLFRR